MSTITMEQKPSSNIILIIIITIIFFVTGLTASVSYITYNSHAVERHGSNAISVRQCLSNDGSMEVWLNENTGREAHLCKVGEKFGLQIQKDGREITSFVKDKLSRIDQVYKYLSNKGYTTKIK